jgi:hypothetical protein
MSWPERFSQAHDDETEAHIFSTKNEASGIIPTEADDTQEHRTPSLVSLPWATQWAAADAEVTKQ